MVGLGGGIQKPQSDVEASGSGYETIHSKKTGAAVSRLVFRQSLKQCLKLLWLVLGPDCAASVTGRAHGRQLPE